MLDKKLKILLIENDNIEVEKLKKSISGEFSNYEISLANSGSKALSYLEGNFPDIILLDLNMSDTNGIEFLSIVKGNSKLKHIPIIVLTISKNDNDVKECYKLGIAGYLLKSLSEEDYEIKMNAILKYWSLNEFILP